LRPPRDFIAMTFLRLDFPASVRTSADGGAAPRAGSPLFSDPLWKRNASGDCSSSDGRNTRHASESVRRLTWRVYTPPFSSQPVTFVSKTHFHGEKKKKVHVKSPEPEGFLFHNLHLTLLLQDTNGEQLQIIWLNSDVHLHWPHDFTSYNFDCQRFKCTNSRWSRCIYCILNFLNDYKATFLPIYASRQIIRTQKNLTRVYNKKSAIFSIPVPVWAITNKAQHKSFCSALQVRCNLWKCVFHIAAQTQLTGKLFNSWLLGLKSLHLQARSLKPNLVNKEQLILVARATSKRTEACRH